jgi:hypothetical protein
MLLSIVKPVPVSAIVASDLEQFRAQSLFPSGVVSEPSGGFSCRWCGVWLPMPCRSSITIRDEAANASLDQTCLETNNLEKAFAARPALSFLNSIQHHSLSGAVTGRLPTQPRMVALSSASDISKSVSSSSGTWQDGAHFLDLPITEEASSQDGSSGGSEEAFCAGDGLNIEQDSNEHDAGSELTKRTEGFLDLPDLAHLAASAWFAYRASHVLGLAVTFGKSISHIPELHRVVSVPPDKGLSLSHGDATILEAQRLSAQSSCLDRYVPPTLFLCPMQQIPTSMTTSSEQPECKQQ